MQITNHVQAAGTGTIHVTRRGKKGSIILIALTRPKVRNAFSDGMYRDLTLVLQTAAGDDSISAVVLTGTGPYFSSGADLKNMNLISNESEDELPMSKRPSGQFMLAMIDFPKIIAAAVNGPTVGIGLTLLCHCDLSYCVKEATFWSPFTRIALVPEFCSSMTFVKTMGLAKANELLLLGQKIDANTAVNWNICSKIIPTKIQGMENPFHELSIGSYVCRRIDEQLLSLPAGDNSARIFVEMVRRRRSNELKALCIEELNRLDERVKNGECLEAITQLKFVKSKL